jgi:hypothetical protein
VVVWFFFFLKKLFVGNVHVQLDVEVVFDYPNVAKAALDGHGESDGFDCSQGGAAHRGVFGPFGLLVLADENLQERTAVFFYVSYSEDGKWRTRFCSDQTRCVSFEITVPVLPVTHVEQFSKRRSTFLCRSSLLPDVDTTVYGSFVEVLPSEDFLSLRVLVSTPSSELCYDSTIFGNIFSPWLEVKPSMGRTCFRWIALLWRVSCKVAAW